MALTLIIGPMKSGKSNELIGYFMPFKYTDISYALYHSSRNPRGENILSRTGMELMAKKVDDLSDALSGDYRIIGVDEIHMFDERIVSAIDELLKRGAEVVVSGLDMDYRGEMFPVIKKLIELAPKEVRFRRAVCEFCKIPDATYTQILKNGEAVLSGLPSVVPDDGTHVYKAVCRKCFKKSETQD